MAASRLNDADLYVWQSPQDMHASVEMLREQLGWDALKRAGKNFREAFVAARFAEHVCADAVKLLKPGLLPTPDFAITRFGCERWYETTEADRPGRERGNELPSLAAQEILDSHWVEPDAYYGVVQARVRSKANKRYERCDGLIVWSNAFPISQEEQLNRDWWRSAVQLARERFDEIWVHFRGEFLAIHKAQDT